MKTTGLPEEGQHLGSSAEFSKNAERAWERGVGVEADKDDVAKPRRLRKVDSAYIWC